MKNKLKGNKIVPILFKKIMKILNIDYHIDAYSAEINNCIDYNIAAATSFYCKDFLKLYCAYWAIYSNWLSLTDAGIKILKFFGLELCYEEKVTKENLIEYIKQKIDSENPVLLNVVSSALFYSIMYNNKSHNGHSILITGYDDTRKIIYFRENTINVEVLGRLTRKQPFSSYQMTYNMLIEIFEKSTQVLSDKYNSYAFSYVQEFKKVNCFDLQTRLLKKFLKVIKNNKDLLVLEVEDVINGNQYKSWMYDEQFIRTYHHSLEALFELIESELSLKENVEYLILKNKYFSFRKQTIHLLARNALKETLVDSHHLSNYIIGLQLFDFLFEYYQKGSLSKKSNNNLLLETGVSFSADSERKLSGGLTFSAANIIKNSKINDNFYVWQSSNEICEHWLSINLQKISKVRKIIIEHNSSVFYITKSFALFGSIDGISWNLIINIKNNDKAVNNLYFEEGLEYQYFKITIYEANSGRDFIARICNMSMYKI